MKLLRSRLLNILPALIAPAALLVAGCGGRVSASDIAGIQSLSIHAATSRLDTNGSTRYSATLPDGKPAHVEWSVSGGDPKAGAGTITADGTYTPPSYLTEDTVKVSVSAVLASASDDFGSSSGTADLTVAPGFLQPLTPGNLSVGPGGAVTISGSISEVGGQGGIRFVLASGSGASPLKEVTDGSAGTLSSSSCARGSISGPSPAYTVCSVTFTAPTTISSQATYFIVGSLVRSEDSTGSGATGQTLSQALSWTRVLLNPAGITSNPASHQAHLPLPVQLGSSSGNNFDYDSSQGQLSDCCGGTLGALLQDTSGNQYLLSNNHVLARSDQSTPGEAVIQPGLIDNGCKPYGVGPGTNQVGTLMGYPPLSLQVTNVDVALARVAPGAVDTKGSILEFGAKQLDGTLAAAPPGISSSNGSGEAAKLGMQVAKSGRTTGLTCAAVSAVDVDVVVDYFSDCAETSHTMTKTFTHQIAIAGTDFSDAGDSGALVVDAENAEPVGLFFASGTDTDGVEHAIANPVSEVLATLDNQVPGVNGITSYSFVGGADHPVSCLNYGARNNFVSIANPGANTGFGAKSFEDPQAVAMLNRLESSERERAESVLPQAQALFSTTTGVSRISVAASKDHPGEGAVAIVLEQGASLASVASLPAAIGGVATQVANSVQPGAGPGGPGAEAAQLAFENQQASQSLTQPRAASLNQVRALKQRVSSVLMAANPAIFGVGVGQSQDNPNDAALILFVDRKKLAGKLPDTIEGQRVRVILMDRLHVTRSHRIPMQRNSGCLASTSIVGDNETPGSGPEPDFFGEQILLPN